MIIHFTIKKGKKKKKREKETSNQLFMDDTISPSSHSPYSIF